MNYPDEIDQGLRNQMITLARRKEKRTLGYPNRWHPTHIPNPGELENFFTNKTAWEFFTSLLQNNHPVEIIKLKKPSGKKGYVLHKKMPDGQMLYIKVQLGPGKILGRSFHYSNSSKN